MEQQEKFKPEVVSEEPANVHSFHDTDLQKMIGWILRIGIYTSIGIVIIGGIFFLYRHAQETANYHAFNGVPVFVHNFGDIFSSAFSFKGQAIIQLGIILLVATPVVRVIFAAIGFLLEKDYLYTVISAIVLMVILLSAFSGHAG